MGCKCYCMYSVLLYMGCTQISACTGILHIKRTGLIQATSYSGVIFFLSRLFRSLLDGFKVAGFAVRRYGPGVRTELLWLSTITRAKLEVDSQSEVRGFSMQ